MTIALSGCGGRSSGSSATSARVDEPTIAAEPSATAAGAAPRPAVSHLPADVVDRPFAPPPSHSVIAADAPEVDARSVYGRRSPDPDAPPIAIVGSSWLRGRPLAVLDEPLCVRAAPGATVHWYATALGTFANGRHDIAVVAGDDGLARVAFEPGQDAGDYQAIAVSPSRTGVATFAILVER